MIQILLIILALIVFVGWGFKKMIDAVQKGRDEND